MYLNLSKFNDTSTNLCNFSLEFLFFVFFYEIVKEFIFPCLEAWNEKFFQSLVKVCESQKQKYLLYKFALKAGAEI